MSIGYILPSIKILLIEDDLFLTEVLSNHLLQEGFCEFQLVRAHQEDDYTLYASHSIWDSRQAFENWTKSEAFRTAHKHAGSNSHLYLGHPKFEGFEMVKDVSTKKKV